MSTVRDSRILVGAGILALLVSAVISGPPGVEGMTLGLVSALFGVAVLWQLILMIGRAATAGRSAGLGTVFTIVAFFAKLPLYVFCGMIAARIGHGAFGCFLAGVVLVYFGLIAWAAARP